MMINNDLLNELSGGLFYLSKSIGNRPEHYSFGARAGILDRKNLIASFMSQQDLDKSLGEIETLDSLVEHRSGIVDLSNFLDVIFKGRVNNSDSIIEYLIDHISFISNDSVPDVFFSCDYKRSYFAFGTQKREHQSGKTLFIPVDDEFLIIHFHAQEKNFRF